MPFVTAERAQAAIAAMRAGTPAEGELSSGRTKKHKFALARLTL